MAVCGATKKQSQRLVARLDGLRVDVDLGAHVAEFLRHPRHAGLLVVERRRVVAHVLRDLHRAEFRAAHRAEMRDLVRLLGQRLVVELLRTVGV